jgi:NAD(P)-dependent dehydrogenase (short-subunit alcohol dehydrogenase family)
MKLVVIGASGNIGRRVAMEALSRGHEVVGVVRDPDAVQPPDPRVRLVKGGATRAEDIARVVRGADARREARPPASAKPPPKVAISRRRFGGAALRTRHSRSYSSWRRYQTPARRSPVPEIRLSLRPRGARSSHWYMPQRPSSPRAYAE